MMRAVRKRALAPDRLSFAGAELCHQLALVVVQINRPPIVVRVRESPRFGLGGKARAKIVTEHHVLTGRRPQVNPHQPVQPGACPAVLGNTAREPAHSVARAANLARNAFHHTTILTRKMRG